MKLTVVGCGDAFGSGGRLQTSYHVATADTQFLIDCGASTLIGLDRQGIAARFEAAAEALFPGSTKVPPRFAMTFREWQEGQPLSVGTVTVTPYEVKHPSGAPPYALRFETEGRVLAFSGDTEWVEAVATAGQNADCLICECYAYEGSTRYHMTWQTIEPNLARIGAKQVVLTHMSHAMLNRRQDVTHPAVRFAEDGLVLEI